MSGRFGVGPEQFGIGAMMCGYGSEIEEQQPIAQESSETSGIMLAEYHRSGANVSFDELNPEHQPDIVPPAATKPAKPATKRKYTKRAK